MLKDLPPPAAGALAMADRCGTCSPANRADWASDGRTLALFWGVPFAAMLASGLLLGATPRAVIWVSMLLVMSVACLVNARRCGRVHCRFTGPFLLLMAVLVAGFAAGALPLGAHGWAYLGGGTLLGFAALWWGSELAWGAFGR